MSKPYVAPVAKSIYFDPDNSPDCDLESEDIQDVIEELCEKVSVSASPGFSFGSGGNVGSGSWLSNETVPSNISGRYVYINNAIVEEVFVSSQNIGTFTLGVYHHEGDETNLTKLGDVTVINSRGASFQVSWAVPLGTQLATMIEDGAVKNPVAGLQLSGTK